MNEVESLSKLSLQSVVLYFAQKILVYESKPSL